MLTAWYITISAFAAFNVGYHIKEITNNEAYAVVGIIITGLILGGMLTP